MMKRAEHMESVLRIAEAVEHRVMEWGAENQHRTTATNPKGMCILACAVGKRVFAQHGLNATEMPVDLMVLSAENLENIDHDRDINPAGARRYRARGDGQHGASRHAWDGHLVLRINGALVDPTAGQAAAPRSGLFVPGAVVISAESMPAQWESEGAYFVHGEGDEETLLRYTPEPSNTGYQRSGHWNNSRRVAELTHRVNADLRRSV